MACNITRRKFVTAALAIGTAGLTSRATELGEPPVTPESLPSKRSIPTGRLGAHQISRLILGGNIIAGYAHARDLLYVDQLMRRYHTESKILETLEIAEANGINAICLAMHQGDISFIQKHWKRGGKMKLIAQAYPNEKDLLLEFKRAVDLGAVAIHVQGHGAEQLWESQKVDVIGKLIDYIKAQKVVAGVAAHALEVIIECEKAGVNADYYMKTWHSLDYPSAKLGVRGFLGSYDNLWCTNPDEVIELMHTIKKPWIAYKVMAAGAIHPRKAFLEALNAGADFILAGMFDWQIEEDVSYFLEAMRNIKRLRPWYS